MPTPSGDPVNSSAIQLRATRLTVFEYAFMPMDNHRYRKCVFLKEEKVLARRILTYL
tara:strand:+ start:38032 stop:38202 length:171 start_codon:yes stop_codon:yes gene_type:complete